MAVVDPRLRPLHRVTSRLGLATSIIIAIAGCGPVTDKERKWRCATPRGDIIFVQSYSPKSRKSTDISGWTWGPQDISHCQSRPAFERRAPLHPHNFATPGESL